MISSALCACNTNASTLPNQRIQTQSDLLTSMNLQQLGTHLSVRNDCIVTNNKTPPTCYHNSQKKLKKKSQSTLTIKINSAFGFRGRLLWLYSFNSFWLLVPLKAGEAGSFSASSRRPHPQQCSGGCGIWLAAIKRDIRFSRKPSRSY